jgi:hypothetical protein
MQFITNASSQEKRPELSGGLLEWFCGSVLPTLDNLRNFLLKPTTEVPSFFQQLREAP